MKFPKRNTQTQQHEAVAQGRNPPPYRLRYTQATLNFTKLNTQTQQRETVVQGRNPPPIQINFYAINDETLNDLCQRNKLYITHTDNTETNRHSQILSLCVNLQHLRSLRA
ncbi:MAG: hypothetical protein LBJ00_04725 [Planctomycetaceae bacterium]|nr:hypothetical protein [Planctomycetaceae bacterium]